MIERGSGRTSGLTDWQLMDVHSMWACLQDQDTTGQWKQVAGWRKICDLALTHLGRLREYRRGLAEAWPPETNAAARAYIGELDQLIDKVQRTHDAAAANYDALAAATRAIGSTRAELKPLYDEYVTKFQQKQAYEEIVADPKAAAGSRLPATSPVTESDLERLNVRARGLMSGLSGELQQAQAMLRQPPPRPVPKVDEQGKAPGPEVAIPVIPPVIPVPAPVESSAFKGRPSSIAVPTPAAEARAIGPILGGMGTGLASAPVSSSTPMQLPPLATPPGISPNGPNFPTTSLPMPAPATGFSNGRGTPIGKGFSNKLPPTTPPREIPTSGLIGGPTGFNQQTGGTASRRINPVGGVIGGGAAGTGPTGAAGSRPGAGRYSQNGNLTGSYPIGGSPAASTGTSSRPMRGSTGTSNECDGRTWDPDNPWQTDEGVQPIMRAPDEDGPIDPGPAIGFNR